MMIWQAFSPLITSVKVYRKRAEFIRSGAMGKHYRITIYGLNFQPDTKVIIDGVEKDSSFNNSNEIVVYGQLGRMPASAEIKIQTRNSNGRFSNVVRTTIRSQ